MKLLHDCIRDVLLCLEDNLEDNRVISTQKVLETIQDYSLEDINYTCKKLNEAGYIKAKQYIGREIVITEITYNGHMFLDNIRDNAIWKETKSKISKLASVSLPVIQQVASQLIAKSLGIM